MLEQPGIGNGTIFNLFRLFSDFDQLVSTFETHEELGDELKRLMFKAFSQHIQADNNQCITVWDETYPQLLKETGDAPVRLFYRGNLTPSIFSRAVSIVGTRKASHYGQKVTEQLVSEFTGYGITTISGMAFGIDSITHKSSLKHNVQTIAVLGSSIDDPTPRAHINLYHEIVESGGLVISEYPDQTETVPGMFASRNRIIAGLSQCSVIVEAGEKSGALITASLALENNRDVFAVPGSVLSPTSVGTNSLIQKGEAELLCGSSQILANLAIKTRSVSTKIQIESLSQDEKIVVELLLSTSQAIDEIQQKVSINNVASVLSSLELKGIVERVSGKYELCVLVE